MTAVHAIGLVNLHNMASSSIVIFILPVSYLLLRIDVPLNTVLLINIIPWVLECVIDSWIIHSVLHFSVRRFFIHTYLRILAYGAVLLAIPYSITFAMPQDNFIRFLAVRTCSVITFCVVGFFFVLNQEGRQTALRFAREKLTNFRNRWH